ATTAGESASTARHGRGGVDPGGDRGDRPAHGETRSRADQADEPCPGRWRRAQLRGEREIAARGPVSEDLGAASRRRRGRGPWGGLVCLASVARRATSAWSGRLPSRFFAWSQLLGFRSGGVLARRGGRLAPVRA